MHWINNGDDFEAEANEYSLPRMRGVEIIHIMRGSVARAARNYAFDKPNSAIVGAPVANTNFITFTNMVNFLQSRIQETDAVTMYAFQRPRTDPAVSGSMIISTYTSIAADNSGASFGASIYNSFSSVAGVQVGGARKDGATQLTGSAFVQAPVIANFSMIVGVVPGGTAKNEIHNVTSGQSVISSQVAAPRFRSRGLFRIGSGFASAFSGELDMAMCVLASVAHDPIERQENGNRCSAPTLLASA